MNRLPPNSARGPLALLLICVAAAAGCAGGDAEVGRHCTLGAECVSGVCRADGTCAPLGEDADDAGPDVEVGDDAGADLGAGDAGEEAGGGDAGDLARDGLADVPDFGGSGACQPDHDGVVTRAELPLAAGYEADFRVTTGVSGFGTTPDCEGDVCTWDLVDIAGTTEDRALDTLSLDGRWFADEPAFAGATYAAPVGELAISWFTVDLCRQDQLGVFEVTDDALLLLGIASTLASEGTLLVYDPPLPLLELPLAEGASWTAETTASGPLCNSLFDYHIDQTLTAEVDAVGSVRTPYGTFEDVVRVNSLLERHLGVGVLPTSVRTQSFVAECFTTIATIQSDELVEEAEFDAVAEVRRLVGF